MIMKIKLTAEYFPDVPSFLISSAPGVARVTKSIRSARFLRMFRLIRDLIQWWRPWGFLGESWVFAPRKFMEIWRCGNSKFDQIKVSSPELWGRWSPAPLIFPVQGLSKMSKAGKHREEKHLHQGVKHHPNIVSTVYLCSRNFLSSDGRNGSSSQDGSEKDRIITNM